MNFAIYHCIIIFIDFYLHMQITYIRLRILVNKIFFVDQYAYYLSYYHFFSFLNISPLFPINHIKYKLTKYLIK